MNEISFCWLHQQYRYRNICILLYFYHKKTKSLDLFSLYELGIFVYKYLSFFPNSSFSLMANFSIFCYFYLESKPKFKRGSRARVLFQFFGSYIVQVHSCFFCRERKEEEARNGLKNLLILPTIRCCVNFRR